VQNRNTPLHLAATSGLLSCIELLLAHNAPLFVYNIAGQTPCEVAGDAKQLIIAKLLESKMVFMSQGSGPEEGKKVVMSRARHRSFYNTETLSKLRADIIHHLATDLQITDFSAQALLMAYSWSDVLVKEAWSEDRAAACEKAGLDQATVVLRDDTNIYHTLSSSLSNVECNICCLTYTPDNMVQVPCSHHFCTDCWKQYLSGEIEQGLGREIRCPEHNCYKIIPNETISKLVPRPLYEKYTSLNLSNFVDTYSAVKWCPYPNCGSAVSVKREEGGGGREGRRGQSPPAAAATEEGICLGFNVECCNGHGFCWHCVKEPHEPCDCKLWQRWTELISTNGDVDGAIARLGQEAAANAQWIVNFTKPCPQCSSPIQKNEGCNHLTCKTCAYDFCWVCMDPWHLHSYKTGGYFTCNRFKEQQAARETVEKARRGMMEDYTKTAKEQETAKRQRFEQCFSRYSNHLNSLEMELNLLQKSQRKTTELAKLGQVLEKKVAATRKKVGKETETGSILDDDTHEATATAAVPVATEDGNFLDDVIRVLLNARRVLSASYCIGYFLPPESMDFIGAHETLQGKLEEVVEMLSEVVNRPYLRTPQDRLQEMARNVDHVCEEYLHEMKEVARAAAHHSLVIFQKTKEEDPPRPMNPDPPPNTTEELEFDPDLLDVELHLLLEYLRERGLNISTS
jgi:ankyrin repeat/IBR domain-containing protein 1